MDITQAISKIDKYIGSITSMPVIVDVPDSFTMKSIKEHYDVGTYKFLDLGQIIANDNLPTFDKLFHKLSTIDNVIFLYGVSTYLKLLGAKELNRILKTLLEFVPLRKLIILTHDCSKYLQIHDPRIKNAGRLVVIDTEETEPIKIHFVSDDLSDYYEIMATGINQLSKLIELAPTDEIYISSKYGKKDFPNSIFEIKQHSSAYDAICEKNNIFANLTDSIGSSDDWNNLLRDLKDRSWTEIIQSKFGGENNLGWWITKYPEAPDYHKWLYFLAIKTCGVPHNEYLAQVAADCKSVDEFPKLIFNTILRFEIKNKEQYASVYIQRKNILKAFTGYHSEITGFCQRVNEKKEKMIYYLTDNNQQEVEKIFEFISQYSDKYSRKELMDVLKTIYPDLHSYLQSYSFSIPLLDDYFNDYKYCKVINKIEDGFRSKVNRQAVERDYNLVLKPRATHIHDLKSNRAIAYFVDAMGVEYLSFIQAKCAEKGLRLDIKVGRCELPSLTYLNKEFVMQLSEKGVETKDVKDLDEIKHGGITEFDYTKTHLPIHLYMELNIINEILDKASMKLNSLAYDRVYLISDHGASRLAVINEKENQWEMQEKGKHSGRCCLVSEIDEQPESATQENNYWCLANYDRFRGGRKASVEVHGGASLEEVAVPIIEITKADNRIDCQIPDAYKTIFVSFKKKALIRLYISSKSKDLRIYLNDKFYPALIGDTEFYYDFEMPDVKRAGIYTFDVYDGDNIIAQNLTFEIKKEGASERNLF